MMVEMMMMPAVMLTINPMTADDDHDALQQFQWILQPRWLGWNELGELGESGKTVDSDESRVAKCHIFYTEQIFQTKFYPMKSA